MMLACDLVVEGGAVLAMDAASTYHRDGAIAIEDGRIVAIGARSDLGPRYTAAQRIDAAGMAVLPGFVNSHGHAGLVLLRGLAEELPLEHWLTQTVWPLMRHAGPEETLPGARLACLEMIQSGITACTDMWRDVAATAQAVEESGLRARLAFNMRDHGEPSKLAAEWQAGFDALAARPTARLTYGLAPHSLYACSMGLLRRCAEQLAGQGCHLQIHVAETQAEVDTIAATCGRSPIERLDELGLLSRRTLIAHGVWLGAADCRRVAAAGAAIAHNPTSNLKLGSGIAPLARFAEAGITVALGTDSAASNNTLDPFREMRVAGLAQRALRRDPAALSPEQLLQAATRNGARALGLEEIGSLEPGKRADLILIDLDKPHLTPRWTDSAERLMALLVFAGRAQDVDTTIVEGKVLMRGRHVLTLDAERVKGEAQRAAKRLLARA
ncbi:MAG: amidohydrolase family protein [Pseudomonadota bacterium]